MQSPTSAARRQTDGVAFSLKAASYSSIWNGIAAPSSRDAYAPSCRAYVRYFVDRPHASANQVLWVVPSGAREEQLGHLLRDFADADREGCRFWITTHDLLDAAGPLAAIWSDGVDRARQSLASMPGLARTHRPIEDSIGKPEWWLRRLSGGAGA